MLQNYKTIKYSVLLFLFFYINSNAQTIQWQNTIGGEDTDWVDIIELTSDGNYLSGGYSYSNISRDKTENSRGSGDYWVFKIDDNTGGILWQKTIGGNNFDHLTSAKQTADGGYILAGYSSSSISGEKSENSRGGDDYWVVKLDTNRNIIWNKTYGGTGTDRLTSIIETADGGYLMGGSSDSNISGEKSENCRGNLDMWLIKINATGVISWQKTFGGSKSDWVESIIQKPNGDYVLAGSSHSNISGEKTEDSYGLGDYWILKINPSGTIVWQKTIGGNNGDYAKSIVTTSDGNYIIGGDSTSNISGDKNQNTITNSTDIWLVKINDNGQLLWQKNIGGNSTDTFENLRLTPDNGIILATMSYSGISGVKTESSRGERDYWIIKLDLNGNIEWDKTLGGDNLDQTKSIVQAKDGGFVTVGWSRSNASGDKTENKSGLQDIWIVKLKVCSQNVSISGNSPICKGNPLQLAATGGTNYLWIGPNGFTSTEQNPLILNVNESQSGQYTCNITETGGCATIKNINIKINIQPLPLANSPQEFCAQQNATLSDIIITGQNIKWYDSISDGSLLTDSALLQNGINYYATQTINNCESNRILINAQISSVQDCDLIIDDSLLSYPKYFTPNGDGYNDTWEIKFSDIEEKLTVKIFDRYGKLITILNQNQTWNGTLNNQQLPATDYWFIVTRADGKELKGHFSLKR
jgi:gliding motility-associated-like protein